MLRIPQWKCTNSFHWNARILGVARVAIVGERIGAWGRGKDDQAIKINGSDVSRLFLTYKRTVFG